MDNSANLNRANPGRAKAWVALMLTFTAGFADIVGFLSVYHTFTAQMTGTTVHLAHWLVQHNWAGAGVAASAVAAFVLGSVAGRIVIEVGSRLGVRSVASLTLVLELLMLAAFLFFANRVTGGGIAPPTAAAEAGPLIALLAGAMGMQTATLTRVGALTIHTTFLTGMLNKLAQLIAHGIFHSYDLIRAQLEHEKLAHRDLQHQAIRNGLFLFVVWSCYLAGAAAGSVLESRWRLNALYVPLALLVIAIGIDQWRPLSVEQERDQPER